MRLRYCPGCGGRLRTTTTPGCLPRRVCPDCHAEEVAR